MPWVKSNFACIALVVALQTQTARAQGDLLGADEMAEAIVSMTSPVWTGPRTPAPIPTARPTEVTEILLSPHSLLAVHSDSGVDQETQRRAMAALEHARSRLDILGWPDPISDGDLGSGPEIDIYLTSSLPRGAYSDGLVRWMYLDRASTFAVMDASVPYDRIDACATAAYAEALLLSADPAEAEAWRRATAAWLSWELTGRFGCDDAVQKQQAEPFRSWIGSAADGGAGGALWLAYLSARHDGGSGQFVRDVWTLASQRTWEGMDLRADPDLWSAIDTAVARSGDRLEDNIEELAVLRWFVGRGEPRNRALACIDDDAKVPVSRTMKRIPSRITSAEPLRAFGSAYVVMSAPAWNDALRLHAWFRGEYGVRWSFVAVQLDNRGNEIRRIAAPHTSTAPRAYLPIDLEDTTDKLLFVITHLSSGLPDADELDATERSFELIVDVAD